MTGQTHDDVDWTEVGRRGRRRRWLLLPVVPAFFGCVVLLTGKVGVWEGRAAWLAVGGLTALALVATAVGGLTERLSSRTDQGLRIHHALWHRVDPGPGLRERADVSARMLATSGWLGWVFPSVLLAFLPQARWDRPLVAVPSALVLVCLVTTYVLWWRRQAAAARRWVADPPGPERTAPPPTVSERFFSGRGLRWVFLGLFLFAVLSSLVLVLVLD
jgi:hypothetical protein